MRARHSQRSYPLKKPLRLRFSRSEQPLRSGNIDDTQKRSLLATILHTRRERARALQQNCFRRSFFFLRTWQHSNSGKCIHLHRCHSVNDAQFAPLCVQRTHLLQAEAGPPSRQPACLAAPASSATAPAPETPSGRDTRTVIADLPMSFASASSRRSHSAEACAARQHSSENASGAAQTAGAQSPHDAQSR